MGDGITVSGGGSTAIATDELFTALQQLQRLALEAGALSIELGSIDRRVSMNSLAGGHGQGVGEHAESDIDRAKVVLGDIEAESRKVAGALSNAAEAYGFIERLNTEVGTTLAQGAAALLGVLVRFAGTVSPITALAGFLAVRSLVHAHVFEGNPAKVPSGPHDHNELLTNPLTVDLVRAGAMSLDDGMLTAAGVPYPVAEFLGGIGLAGMPLAAAGLLRAGSSVGLLTETPVRPLAQQVRAVEGPPSGFSDWLARVPDPETNGGAQVVVEKYEMPGQPDAFAVYVAGTASFSPEATTEPWDMTSNIANAAGGDSGSYHAVVEAMRLAGVQDSSPVVLTGYSQGGGTAARIAASGDFDVVGLTTFGGPTGQIPIPASVPAVIVEHTDDIVPALGGTQANQQALIVERDVFAGRDIPNEYAVPAHHIEYYEETARLMDAATSDQLKQAAARLTAFGAGATSVTSTAYTFGRVEG